MGLLKILFIILFIFSYPLGEVARFIFGEAAVSAVDVSIGLIVLVWLFLKVNSKEKIKGHLLKPVFVFVCIAVLSLLVNANKLTPIQLGISASYIARWVLYAALYFVVKDLDLNFKKKFPYFMIISGALIIVLGFIQYFLYPDLRNLRYLGWDEHLYRMFSSFLDPNFAGAFFVLYFLFIFEFVRNIKKHKVIFISILILSLISILLTFSRSAYIMFLVGVGNLLIIKGQTKKLLLVILFFGLSLFLVSQLVLKSEGTNILRTASGEARIDSINNALVIFRDNPVLGVGFNSYRYAQRRYGFVNENKMLIHSAAGTDNSFLFVLATAGIVGFLSFLYLIYKIIDLSKIKMKNQYAIILFASIISLSINSLFVNSLFFPQIVLWIWLLAGLTEST